MRRLRRTAREHGLVPIDGLEMCREPLLQVEKDRLIAIMRETGFSEEQIAQRRADWDREDGMPAPGA